MVQSVVNEYEFEPVHLPDFHCDIHLWRDERSIFFLKLPFYPKDICTKLQFPVTKTQVQQISLLILIYFYHIFLDDKASHIYLVVFPQPMNETYASSSNWTIIFPGIRDEHEKTKYLKLAKPPTKYVEGHFSPQMNGILKEIPPFQPPPRNPENPKFVAKSTTDFRH